MSLIYESHVYNEVEVYNFWKFKTESGHIWCLLNSILNLFNRDFYLQIASERITNDSIRVYQNFTDMIPHPDIDLGDLFIDFDCVKMLIREPEQHDRVKWLFINVFNSQDMKASDLILLTEDPAVASNIDNLIVPSEQNEALMQNELNGIFEELTVLFTTKKRGHDFSFFVKSFMKIWHRLILMGNKIEWIKNMTTDISTLEFEKTYLLFNRYNDKFTQYNILFIITKIIMYFNGETIFDHNESKKTSSKMFSIIKHKNKENTPFHVLSLNNLTKSHKKRFKMDDVVMNERKIEACRMMTNYKYPEINFSKLVPLGDPLSLNDANAGPDYKKFERAIQSHSQFLLELSNREITGYSSTYAVVKTDFDN